MAPRVLPLPRHEQVALLPESNPPEASEPKAKSRFDDRINPRWLRVNGAIKYSGINRSRLFKLIAEGAIKTASLKEHQRAKRGLRLIDRLSLDLYLETLCRPMEERLVEQANELSEQEALLKEQQQALEKKQHEIDRQLAAMRKRRAGGDSH